MVNYLLKESLFFKKKQVAEKEYNECIEQYNNIITYQVKIINKQFIFTKHYLDCQEY